MAETSQSRDFPSSVLCLNCKELHFQHERKYSKGGATRSSIMGKHRAEAVAMKDLNCNDVDRWELLLKVMVTPA